MPAPKPAATRYICRFEGVPVKGWRVWIVIRGVPICKQTYFPDKRFGGRDSALIEAVRFRNKILEEQRIKLRDYPDSKPKVRSRSTYMEIAGVALKPSVTQPEKPPRCVIWQASYSENGEGKKKAWSIRKYGYIGAWRLAMQHRLSKIVHAEIPPPRKPPAPPKWLIIWAKERDLALYNALQDGLAQDAFSPLVITPK